MDEKFESILLAEKQIKLDLERAQGQMDVELKNLEISKDKILTEVVQTYERQLEQLRRRFDNEVTHIQMHMDTLIKSKKEAYQSEFEKISTENREDMLQQVVTYHES